MECIELFNHKLPARPYHADELTNGLKINKKENHTKCAQKEVKHKNEK